MRKRRITGLTGLAGILILGLTTLYAVEGGGEKPSVATMPPVVVKTSPQAGDTKVDAQKVKEIRVTFSKDMMDKSWSWSQISDETFPEITGKIRYESDKRSCVLPCKLAPGRTYVFWLNSAKFGNFKDRDGRSAVPYLLVFETGKQAKP